MTIRGAEYSPGQFITQLVANATFGTQGVSGTFDAGGYASLTAVVTFNTGTGSQFRLWIQGSIDNGATWYGLPVTNLCKTIVGSAGLNETGISFSTNQHSIINEAGAFTGTTMYVASVNCPPPLIRAAWNINGTSPSMQFGIACVLSSAIVH